MDIHLVLIVILYQLKILFPKYGDGGQRIARYSRNTEFWRYNYYENLDYIFVHTPESDKLEETI